MRPALVEEPAVRRDATADGAGSLGAECTCDPRTARAAAAWRCGSRSLGGFAVVLFAVLFFRLWNLQVIDGAKYLAEAKNNRTRETR